MKKEYTAHELAALQPHCFVDRTYFGLHDDGKCVAYLNVPGSIAEIRCGLDEADHLAFSFRRADGGTSVPWQVYEAAEIAFAAEDKAQKETK
jgi:hypothetical protein